MPFLLKRRWLRFSVRTLLAAVTIFCVWLGWQMQIVRERKVLRDAIEHRGGWVDLVNQPNAYGGSMWLVYKDQISPVPSVPTWRQWLGDVPIERVVLPLRASRDEWTNARRAFDEARTILVLIESKDDEAHTLSFH